MTIDPILFYSLVSISLVVTAVLGILVGAYAHVLKKWQAAETERKNLLKDTDKKAEKILEETEKTAHDITTQAYKKAEDIVQNAELFTSDTKASVTNDLSLLTQQEIEEFKKVTQQAIQEYSKELQQVKEEDINIFKNISKNIEQQATRIIDEFKAVLEKETLYSQKAVEQKIEQEYSSIHKELDSYKAQMHEKIDKNIYQLLITVSKLVFGKAMSFQEHEQLVLQALEQAKKEQFFGTSDTTQKEATITMPQKPVAAQA